MTSFSCLHIIKGLFTFLFLIPFLYSCSPDDPGLPSPYWGTASTEFNGAYKFFQISCSTDEEFLSIVFNCDKCNNSLDYRLYFNKIKMEEYTIDSLEDFYLSSIENTSLYSASGGDVLIQGYNLLKTEVNYLEITQWDPINEEVNGRFQVSFIRDTLSMSTLGLDTVRLLNGKFHTRVYR